MECYRELATCTDRIARQALREAKGPLFTERFSSLDCIVYDENRQSLATIHEKNYE